jgi:eukaryotic-like serine/threonine-protein kinase
VSALPEDPTVAQSPAKAVTQRNRRSSGSLILGSGSGSGTRSAPLETLERDEIRRTRWFCYVSFMISLVAGASLVWLDGDPVATVLLLGALAASVLATVFMLYRTRDPVQFRRPSTGLGWLVPSAATTMAIPYFGAFSPAPVVLVLGIYFTGLGKSPRLAYVTYVVSATVQGLVGLFSITGTARDTGLVHAGNLDTHRQLIIQGLVQFVFATTLFVARMSRRTQLVAIEELEREVRLSAHREALLIEAREQLDRALRPGRGRFSDQQIGAYLLGAVIGRGAMGEVYEASGPGGLVAIKLLSQTSLGNTNHVLRFFRELRTAAAIEAPNVVRVLEVGQDPVPYLVMERLDGKTLSEILRSKRALTAADVIDLVRQVGAGITAAGAAGVVHRDLKPQNVFRHGATWKILDFGVARALDQSDTLTAGQVVGTPAYMAPEQANGGAVDHATDLYALAAIAYRALTGHQPFSSGDVAETLYRVVHTVPRRPSDLVTSLPHEVDLVLAIGLAKQPADRFASADELARALEGALTGRLAPAVRHRGFALVRAGAWAEAPPPVARPRLAHG